MEKGYEKSSHRKNQSGQKTYKRDSILLVTRETHIIKTMGYNFMSIMMTGKNLCLTIPSVADSGKWKLLCYAVGVIHLLSTLENNWPLCSEDADNQ